MNTAVIPFKVPVLTPAFSAEQEMFCSKRNVVKSLKRVKGAKMPWQIENGLTKKPK